MPRATTSVETVRHSLKSAPPDGFVDLRPMDYGDFLKRRDMAMKMGVRGAGSKIEKIDLDILQEEVTRFEFKVCVGEHNLEDANGRLLVLGDPKDFKRLDPKIGQEISDLISEMIQWEGPKRDGDASEGDRADVDVPEDGEA